MKVYLGIGTNLGDRQDNLNQALALIREHVGSIIKSSPVYETEPWGFKSKDYFLNIVIEVETKLKPSGLLGRILMVEANMGRLRDSKGYSSRIIDIDILFYGSRKFEQKTLVIPHPRLHKRRFILVPLCEIAPDMVHPVFGKTMKVLLKECKDKNRVKKYGGGKKTHN
jgi:2-amino-4-hydroxy-6-hydroxymethyldihydropteridine diphosphokinase